MKDVKRDVDLGFVDATTLSDRTLTHMRDLIIAGKIEPGRWFRMADLALSLGTSITPVRTALLALEREGLVEVAKARGVRVTPVTRKDIRDAYLVQAFLSGELASRAAKDGDDEFVQELEELQRRMELVVRGKSSESIDDLNWHFHRTINVRADSPRLARILRLVTRSVPHDFHRLVPGWSKQAMKHHRALMQALAAGLPEQARRVAEEHVRTGCDLLIKRLEKSHYWSNRKAPS